MQSYFVPRAYFPVEITAKRSKLLGSVRFLCIRAYFPEVTSTLSWS